MSATPCGAGCAAAPLLELRHVSVRYGAHYALRDLSLALHAGAHLGVEGGNGSGKSTLLRLIAGEAWPDPATGGTRTYQLGYGPERDALTARQRIRLVGPELQDRYQHQRLNPRGAVVVATGLTDSPILRRRLTAVEQQRVRKSLLRAGARALADRRFLELSRGEQRRLLIARALVADPAILCLDEICDGLDRAAAAQLLATLERLAGQGVTLVMATHHRDEVPAAVTRWVTLDGGRMGQWPAAGATPVPPAPGSAALAAAPLIDIRNASVYRGRQRVLAELHWQLAPGESWLIRGGNGAGKSTLLKLLHAELRPANGGVIDWFALGPRPDVWTLRRRIALVSDELQSLHSMALTVRQCVATGFVASIGRVPRLTLADEERVDHCLALLAIATLADRPVRALSYGQLRRALLARALVIEPEVLLLDEPCSGLDRPSQAQLLAVLTTLMARGVSVVMTAHRASPLDRLFPRGAELRDGRLLLSS